MSRRAVFLDKDGTLVENVPYNVDLERIRLTDGAIEGLRALNAVGYLLIVVTNQSGVARGYFPESALLAVEGRLRRLLAAGGVPLHGFYYCPHEPDGTVQAYARRCVCRKPAPGLLRRGARDHRIDLTASWMIGDILHDVEAGRRASCRTVLLDNGNETEWRLTPARRPEYRAADLRAAACAILTAPAHRSPVPSMHTPLTGVST